MAIFYAINIFSKGITSMATQTEQQLAVAKQNLAAAQKAYLTSITPGDSARVKQLEDSVAYLEQRARAEAGSGFTTTNSDGSVNKFDAQGVLTEVVEPPQSSEQKTATVQGGTTITQPLYDPQKIIAQDTITPSTSEGSYKIPTVTVNNQETITIPPAVAPPAPPAPAVVPQGQSKIHDWRVKLSLADGSDYLYNDPDVSAKDSKHILKPLHDTKGIVFPYMPAISLSYRANYDPAEITHSNYKLHFYRGSSVDDITITADFTAQDTTEAKYLLAVIHFFRSVTKMFYGQDQGPVAGTPPPMCFLSGLGAYQFNKHPIVISSFSYSLPTDVDYIRTEAMIPWAGSGIGDASSKDNSPSSSPNFFQKIRLKLSGIKPQAAPPKPVFKSGSLTQAAAESTYVPTKMQITLGAHVIVSRADISKNFSLTDYASGKLIKEKGIW